jgi:hypothetical protein
VTTNTGYIKYNQTFEFQCSLTRHVSKEGASMFVPKYLNFDVIVKKTSKIETVSRDNKLNLAQIANLNRQVAERETITVTIHEGMHVPLYIAIFAVPSVVVGKGRKSLDIMIPPPPSDADVISSPIANNSSNSNNNNNNNNSGNNSPPAINKESPPTMGKPSKASPTKESLPGDKNIKSPVSAPPQVLSTSTDSVFDLLEMVPITGPLTGPQVSNVSTNRSASLPPQNIHGNMLTFQNIARRRMSASSGNHNSPPSNDLISRLQKENADLKRELQLLKEELERLREENAQLKKQVPLIENPFDEYANEEQMFEVPFHLHTADTIDTVDNML